ncbi:hypothetical protein JOB18_012447 [Solea senegalensis]|uniref:Uncharacterized protein n=1 Tax=Solea senegalensis TaxID=28829 RepID=A0AAV6T5F2_SOLSE|nr:hypothetical protein JOB18_012447 [Solea senegalensis]
MAVRTLLVACTLFLGMCLITSSRPTETTQAFCNIEWLLALPCAQVNKAIVTEIKSLKNIYKLGTVTPLQIQANHTSAPGQMEQVNFTMTPAAMGEGCRLHGFSMSAVWYSSFSNSTNYCNLQTVVNGSGLTKTPGFMEFTNEWRCLGLEDAACPSK